MTHTANQILEFINTNSRPELTKEIDKRISNAIKRHDDCCTVETRCYKCGGNGLYSAYHGACYKCNGTGRMAPVKYSNISFADFFATKNVSRLVTAINKYIATVDSELETAKSTVDLDTKLGFGKYADESFVSICEKDLGYAKWLVGQKPYKNQSAKIAEQEARQAFIAPFLKKDDVEKAIKKEKRELTAMARQGLGEVGEKVTFKGECTVVKFFDTVYGQSALRVFVTAEGEEVVLFNGGAKFDNVAKGDTVEITTKIKEIKESKFDGGLQTQIIRPKLISLVKAEEV